jgi:thiosulfate dehydrogenase [quinone] large subunit
VGVGSAYAITDPNGGGPGFVVHDAVDSFVAFSAICTHAGCTVNYDGSGERFLCPCHGSIYDAKTGAVEQGPAVSPLPAIPIEVHGGSIYLKPS